MEYVKDLATIISAIGTVIIAGIALRLSWKDRLLQVMAGFDYGLIPGDDPLVLDRKVYILSFTNVGFRTVIISNFEWKIRNFPPLFWKFSRVATSPHLERTLASLCTNFPKELTQGQIGHILHKASIFEELNIKEEFLYPASKCLAFYRILTFKIVLKTTVGRNINVKIPLRVRRYILKQYKIQHNLMDVIKT
ncbi:MAG: hypothetical protein HQ543_08600 [Bacteroidetes bacterium]|nr:hypothetical protein [Bacteroidota bacterium]